jgi:hypothetical protein
LKSGFWKGDWLLGLAVVADRIAIIAIDHASE